MDSLPDSRLSFGGGFGQGLNGGGGGHGTSEDKPQSDEDERACRILRNDSESSQSVLPGYVTGNKNWDNPNTLQGYRNYYQSNVDQWQIANSRWVGYGIVALSTIPVVRGGQAVVRGAGFAMGAAGWEYGNFVQNQLRLNEDRVSALDDRLKVLDAGC